MSQKVAIIDYGMGNLHSVASALAHVSPNDEHLITADHQEVKSADRVIFPGVGAIRDCVVEIKRLGFDELVKTEIDSGKPVLAICVGLQALMSWSEENEGVDCLDFFQGKVNFFSSDQRFQQASASQKMKVPHMGWNEVWQKKSHPLWQGIEDGSRFYFVHSYFVTPEDDSLIAGSSHYGLDFSSVLSRENVFAAQFHPEKSHDSGLQLLKNFCAWDGRP
jgi:glutamine amidotransferase